MKNNTSIKTLLGFTQKEMAILLGVGYSHYTMFESGKRSLPLHATQKLAELLLHVKTQEAKKQSPTDEKYEEQWKNLIESSLRENQYQILLTEKKIAALEKKQHAANQRTLLNASLSKNKKTNHPLLAAKIAKQSRQDHATDLMKLLLKRELLHVEQHFLQSKLRNLKSQ